MAALMWVKGTPVSGLSRSDRRSALPQGLHDPHGCQKRTGKQRGSPYSHWNASMNMWGPAVCVWVCVFPPGQRLHTLLKLPLKLPVPAFKEIPGLVLLITLKIYFIFRKQTQCSLKELASHSGEVWICFYSFKMNLLLFIIIKVSITYSALQTIKAKVDNISRNP